MTSYTPTQLFDQPATVNKYKHYSAVELPKIILGFVIKNKYDESRLKIKPLMQPKSIAHDIGDHDKLSTMHFHGIELEPTKRVGHLCSTIHRAMPITPDSYMNILKYNRLSCDNCIGLLRDGVYPIDIKCLPVLSRNKFKTDYTRLRTMLETNDDLPWFSSWSDFNIFMLCPSFLSKNLHK